MVSLLVLATLLLAIHSGQSYFQFDPSDPQSTNVTHASRILAAALTLAVLALVFFASRRSTRSPERALLQALPIPARSWAAWRADELAAASAPALVLGAGLLLPPIGFGDWPVSLAAIFAWAAWLWAISQIVALVFTWSPEGRWGPGGVGGFAGRALPYLCVPVALGLYFVAREISAAVSDVRSPASLATTAALGAVIGIAARRLALALAPASARAAAAVMERHEGSEWKRARSRRAERRPRLWRPRARGPLAAWIRKEAALARRHRGLRAQWVVVLALKAAALSVGLRPEPQGVWVFAGFLLVLSDAVAGVALLQHWTREQPAWTWGSPSPRSAQWAARAVPALAASLTGSISLALIAWLRAGPSVAKPLALWTGVSGASLVIAAANLGPATPPGSALGENLYGLGLFSAILVGAVYPVVGWGVLAFFALYTVRSLTRDPRP